MATRRAAAKALTRGGGGEEIFRPPAGWRHRFGQDRSLFRSGGGGAEAGQAGADPAAGDRADGAIPGTLRGALRGAARGMAQRPVAEGTPPHLSRRDERRGAGGGGGALVAVPALSRAGPGHRRRRTRTGLQAAGRRHLSRPRHGGGAGADRGLPGGAGQRHAVAGKLRQCPERALHPSETGVAAWRGGNAGSAADRSAP